MNAAGRYCLYLMLGSFAVGCTVGPVYVPPDVDVPCEWHSELSESLETGPAESLEWWERLQDPILDELIAYAAEQNFDLRIAAMRVLQARAEAKGKKGDLYPHIDGVVNYGHVRYSKDALVTGLLSSSLPIEDHHHRRDFNFYEVGFDAEWEIDLFGLKRHEIAALKAQEESVQESLCSIWVTLSAEIAKNYIELRGLQHKREIIDKTIETQGEIVKLTRELFERGIVNDAELLKSEAQWNELIAQMPLIELDISRAIHRISILAGYPPGELFDCLAEAGSLPQLPERQSIGIPSELLRRRPDIRKAERELAAATERIGSAIAALFPRFSLRGLVGDISNHAGSLFGASSATWYAGPRLLVPIFNSRLILQDIEYNKLATQEALYNYQKTVLEALEESENAIASYKFGEERLHHLCDAYRLYQQSYECVEELYQRGVNNYFVVAEAKRSLLAAEDTCLQSRVDQLLHYIALYKALGGSW